MTEFTSKGDGVEKSTVEIKYEEYLQADDTIKEIDGEMYYKPVYIDRFNLNKIGPIISIVLPYSMFEQNSKCIENEKGERFKLYGPEMIRFIKGIPEWYLKCGRFMIKESEYDHPLVDIGQYFIVR